MKTVIYLFFSTFLLLLTSCEVDVPDTDATPPKFSFKVTGDGFSHTFDQDFEFENYQLNLVNYSNYDFVFSGSDDGGLKDLAWEAHGGLEVGTGISPDNLLPGWFESSRYEEPYLEDGIRFKGDPANPLSGSILTGEFGISFYTNATYGFNFTARDYGGLNGVENTVKERLHIFIVDSTQDNEIVPYYPFVHVPDVDETPPEFSFTITGDGFEHIFTQDEDLSGLKLNLNRGVEYKFVFEGTDTGGLKRLSWNWLVHLNDHFTITDPDPRAYPNGWARDFDSTNSGPTFTGNSNREYAKTGASISGKFRTVVTHDPFVNTFSFFARDYEDANPDHDFNLVEKQIQVVVKDQSTALVSIGESEPSL